jgi:hypothetical protein
MKNKNKANKVTEATGETSTANNVETIETEEVVIEQTDVTVLDTPSDITEVQATERVCSTHGGDALPLTTDNFSPTANGSTGGFSTICKRCRVAASKKWTDERADLRAEQVKAVRYSNLGIPVLRPSAKGWTPETVLMTLAYTVMPDGSFELGEVEGGVFHPSRVADEVYAEMKAEKKAASDQRKADAEAQAKIESDQRKADRLAAKQAKEAQALIDRENAKAIRDEERKTRETQRAAQALADKKEKDRIRNEKVKEKARLALEVAEKTRIEKENKAKEKVRLALIATQEAEAKKEAQRIAALEASQKAVLNSLTKTANA